MEIYEEIKKRKKDFIDKNLQDNSFGGGIDELKEKRKPR